MEKLLKNGLAEPASESKITESNLRWYLAHFEVCHPQKLYKIRLEKRYLIEQDPAIKTRPNKRLIWHPDISFRENPVAFMADIKQMFHPFLVTREHRDLLRFFWYKDNDPDGELIEHRVKVHFIGNTSSPAVATYCLRKVTEAGEQEFDLDA